VAGPYTRAVKAPFVRMAAAMLAISALAVGGCGSDAAHSRADRPSEQAPDAQRTQDLVPLTTAQAAQKAQRIALVVSRGSRVVEGAPGTPFTRTTFAVQDVLKGHLPPRFVVQVIGGRLHDTVVTSPVQPFRRSGRYILFLGRDGPAGPTIFPQAVLEVKHAGDADVVEPRPGGLHLRGPPRLENVLVSIQRYLSTEGSP
jgi:hypothetical protein